VFVDHWWVVSPDGKAMVYIGRDHRHWNVLCNRQESIANLVQFEDCTIKQLPVAYLPQSNHP
jgi:hypothetical protein